MSDDHDLRPTEESEDTDADRVDALAREAREACADHPELVALVDQLERLDEVELARRPEVLDGVHRTLREVLTGASRPGRPS